MRAEEETKAQREARYARLAREAWEARQAQGSLEKNAMAWTEEEKAQLLAAARQADRLLAEALRFRATVSRAQAPAVLELPAYGNPFSASSLWDPYPPPFFGQSYRFTGCGRYVPASTRRVP